MAAPCEHPERPAGVAVAKLRAAANSWRSRSDHEFAALLANCAQSLFAAAPELCSESALAKWGASTDAYLAEEWASGPLPVARFLRLLHGQRQQVAAGRTSSPSLLAVPWLQPRDGEVACAALPASGVFDRLLFRGYHAEVHGRAGSLEQPRRRDEVALVLGAGNVVATPLLDVLQQVFVEGRAALLKVSPLHDVLVPHFERALRPLLDAGLVALCRGDAAASALLARDPNIAAVHLTGSPATWQTLREDAVVAQKHLTAETGSCSPVVLLPGHWRQQELLHVARQLAAYVACNGGATCLAPRLLLTCHGWPQREWFLQMLRSELAQCTARVPFMVGAHAAYARATGGEAASGALQPLLRAGLHQERHAELFAAEHFAPVLLEASIEANSVPAFVDQVTSFVREAVFGALSASAFAPPRLLRKEHSSMQQLAMRLPHLSVVVNGWAGLAFALGTTPWGVPADAPIPCGRGTTRGTVAIRAPSKALIVAPFRPRPLPPWLPAHRRGLAALRALTALYAQPAWSRVGRVVFAAMHSL